MNNSGTTIFDSWHPFVPLAFFASVIVLSMAVFQPVFIAISFIGALASSIAIRGWKTTVKSLRWQLPLIVLIVLFNPLFSSLGSTVLFTVGPFTMYAESLVYGICMGVMLVSMLLWFVTASSVLSSSKVMALFGKRIPVLSLMMSMIARLTPLYVRRGREISTVDSACTASGRKKASVVAQAAKRSTVLMSWSMEDSLETSDAMRARGFGASHTRTSYARYRFRLRDGIVSVVLLVLVVCCAFLAWTAASQYRFYPTMPMLRIWWGYIPYIVLVLIPTFLSIKEGIRWMR